MSSFLFKEVFETIPCATVLTDIQKFKVVLASFCISHERLTKKAFFLAVLDALETRVNENHRNLTILARVTKRLPYVLFVAMATAKWLLIVCFRYKPNSAY